MSNAEPTIPVNGYFGEKEINREDFIKRWVDHAKEFNKLSYQEEDQFFLRALVDRVASIAAKEFDRTVAERKGDK